MAAANYLPEVLETTEAERLATGFIFTEGPLWHPEGYWYFVDIRQNKLFRMTPGQGAGAGQDHHRRQRHDLRPARPPDRVRGRRPAVTRMGADGKVESLVDNYKGGRFDRPNDVICHSNGCLYFTDPDKRRAYHEREIPGPAGEDNLWDGAGVYRLAPDGDAERAGAVRIPQRAGAVAGRAHHVRGQHALVEIHPRHQARCRRHTWSGAASLPT